MSVAVASPSPPAVPAGAPLVLVVDDDNTARMIAAHSLAAAGYRTVEAGDGEAALALLEEVRPDAILLDVEMPRLNGFDACARIRTHTEHRNTPVVILTAHDDADSIERAYAVGATDFAAKPVNWTLMRYRLRYVLRNAETVTELARAQRLAGLGSWEWMAGAGTVSWSEELCRLAGHGEHGRARELEDVVMLALAEDRPRLRAAVVAACEGEGAEIVHRLSGGDGEPRVVRHRLHPHATPQGPVARVSGALLDVTERQRAAERIHQLAYYDAVTGLPNRTAFREHLERALTHARRHDRVLGVLYLDLDDFKRVNDSLGHSIGDALLRAVAERVFDTVRAGDIVTRIDHTQAEPIGSPEESAAARLGGDEFAVLLSELSDAADAEQVAQRLLAALSGAFELEGHEVFTTPSIGVAAFPQDGEDAESLLKHADAAMYAAKSAGKRGVRCFDESLSARARRRHELDMRLRHAIALGELALHYQPQVDLASGRLTGVEALLRWSAGPLGAVSPAEFIPIAEENGMIVPIGEWVIRNACAQLARWHRTDAGVPRMSVNVSARQFREPDFVARVASIMQEAGLAAGDLDIEITESLLARDADGAVETLVALKALGIGISVDDFGTGYSSLGYLKRFPIDRLKIDRSFVREVVEDASDKAITTAVIGMARGLGLDVIAEGVETAAQNRLLHDLGCDGAQGYFLSPPLPGDEIADWLAGRSGSSED